MELNKVRVGLRVKTMKLGSTKGFFITQRHLDVRKSRITGTVTGWVPGHGGDIWWVKHDDGTVGAYGFDEFEPIA